MQSTRRSQGWSLWRTRTLKWKGCIMAGILQTSNIANPYSIRVVHEGDYPVGYFRSREVDVISNDSLAGTSVESCKGVHVDFTAGILTAEEPGHGADLKRVLSHHHLLAWSNVIGQWNFFTVSCKRTYGEKFGVACLFHEHDPPCKIETPDVPCSLLRIKPRAQRH
jgi:hypothetical protein